MFLSTVAAIIELASSTKSISNNTPKFFSLKHISKGSLKNLECKNISSSNHLLKVDLRIFLIESHQYLYLKYYLFY
jgi:hypothetical protein